jgi:hypothetical protein
MKPSEITTLFRASAPVFAHQVSAWMMLVTICDAGSAGVTLTKLCLGLNAKSRDSRQGTLKRWTRAGLLERQEIPNSRQQAGTPGGRRQMLYFATPKAFKLLRLEPNDASL